MVHCSQNNRLKLFPQIKCIQMHASLRFALICSAIGASFPLGILSKKVYRRLFPSRPTLVNPKRSSTVHALTILCVVGSSFASWVLNSLVQNGLVKVIPIALFGLGWRCSAFGLTGGIASGKSTASRYFREAAGWTVIDADQVARNIVRRGQPAFHQIVRRFGSDVVDKGTGELDRRALGERVFSDSKQKAVLEKITHPRIIFQMFKEVVLSAFSSRPVMMDVPLLFEPRKAPLLYFLASETIVIDLPADMQIHRLLQRNPELTIDEARNRIASQVDREKRICLADYVINNEGPMEELYKKLHVFVDG
jgi:dephospho-CoA kinase